jgi:hypothetical protein
MAKSLSSQSARARMQKHQKEAPRHAAPDERERIPPAPAAERLGPIISPVHTNDLTLTRNNGLLVSPFLERFLDRHDTTNPSLNQSRSGSFVPFTLIGGCSTDKPMQIYRN